MFEERVVDEAMEAAAPATDAPVRPASAGCAGPALTSGDPCQSWDDPGETWLDRLEAPGFGPVSWLSELEPSGRLLTELEQLPPDLVADEYDAVEMVAHWNRLEAYCAAQKRLAAAALSRRHAMATGLARLDGLGFTVSDPNTAPDELALRLGITRRAASRLVRSGRAMSG